MASPHNAPASTAPQGPPDWIRVPLDGCTIPVDRTPSVPQTRYKAAGLFPVIDQGASFIAGYTDDESVVHKTDLPIILFGDHTRVFKFLDFPFAAGADGTKLLRAHVDRVDDVTSALEFDSRASERKRDALGSLFSSMLHLLMTGQMRVPLDLIGRLGGLPGAGQGSSAGGGQSRAAGQHGKPDEAMLQEIVRRIVAAVAPKEIILFGSAARGEMGPDSDIDLLVVKACEHRREVARAVRDCLRGVAPGRGKDVVVVTPEDVERDRDTIGYIIRPARRDGRVLYAA